MAVVDHLARKGPGGRVADAKDHIVEAGLEDLQQVLTGLAGRTVRLFVVAAELLLHHAVGEAGLLLLLQLLAVFALLDPSATVLAGRIRTLFERLVTTDQVDAEAARLTGGGSGVTSH